MKNNLTFYTELVKTILDSTCSYIIVFEDTTSKLIASSGKKLLGLDALSYITHQLIKKENASFGIFEYDEQQKKLKNEIPYATEIQTLAYSALLDDKNTIIGYLVAPFNHAIKISSSQKKSILLISKKISEQLQKNLVETCKDLNSLESNKFELSLAKDILKKSKKNKHLIDQEQHLAKMGSWNFDFKLDKLTWSDGLYEVFGISKEFFLGTHKSFLDCIVPEDREYVIQTSKNTQITGEPFKITYRIKTSLGDERYIEEHGYSEKDKNGSIIRLIGTAQDITERKIEEQQLKLYESVVTNTKDSVLITEAEPFDASGPRILYVNDAFTEMTGYSKDEVIGKTPRLLYGPKTNKEELKKLSNALSAWQSYETTLIKYDKAGNEFWINFTISPVANENGWYTHWISIERDVTAQKIEEQQRLLLNEISLIFNTRGSLHESITDLLKHISETFDYPLLELWLTDEIEHQLTLYAKYFNPNTKINTTQFYRKNKNIRKKGEGLIGSVWEKGKIEKWISNRKNNTFFREIEAEKAGINKMISIPILYNKVVTGVLAIAEINEISRYNDKIIFSNKVGLHIGAEIKRKQLEQELSKIFNFSPDIICIINKKGGVKRINPAGCNLLEYSEAELLKMSLYDIIHPDDLIKTHEKINSLHKEFQTHYFEIRFITKSGSVKWLAWTFSFFQDGNGYAVAKDLTDKTELENLLQKANKLARIGGWEVDLQNDTVFWSDITKEIHEVALDYIPDLESGIGYYKNDSNKNKITKYVDEAIKTGKSWDDEFQIITAKGKEKWIRVIGEAEFVNTECVRIYGSFQDIHEQKIIEQQKNSLLTTLEKSLNEIYVFDAETLKFSFVNQGALNNIGYSEQEIKELTPLDLKPEFTATIFNQLINPLVTDEKEKIIFFTNHKRKNGTLYPVEIHLQLMAEDNKKRFLAIILDITERKKAEKEIIEYKMALDQSSIVAITNHKGIIQHVNENFCKISKYKSEELIGKDHRIINSGYHTKSFIKDLWVTIANGKIWRGEMCNKAKDGSIYWVNTTIVPLFDEHGKPNKYIAIRSDITARKKAEEELKNTEERRKLIMNSALDAIICIDKEGMITFWNPQAEQIFGWSENEVMDKLLSAIIIPEHLRSMHEKGMQNYLKKGKGPALNVLLQLSAINRNGTEFPIELTILPILQDGEEFFCAFIRDITDRKTYENQLLTLNENLNKQKIKLTTSNKELEQFAYVASHDLQEPLRMVTSFLTLLEKKYNNVLDEKGLKYINFAVEGAKNMRQIILDILDFSRINNNDDVENYELIDLKDILNNAILFQSKLIKDKKAIINMGQLPKVYSINHFLLQIFQNIISNALKYSKDDVPPKITISAREFKNYYQISIKDNGIGIDEEYHDKIFIIFQRLHGKDKYQGNGMGLAIVKKIVEKLKGKILIKSQVGKGSTFYINLPKNKV